MKKREYQISPSIALHKEQCSDPYQFKLEGGYVLYNSQQFFIPPQFINLADFGIPQFFGGYRWYFIVVNQKAISKFFDRKQNILKRPLVISSTHTYYNPDLAYQDIINQLKSNNYPTIIISKVLLLLRKDKKMEWWINNSNPFSPNDYLFTP